MVNRKTTYVGLTLYRLKANVYVDAFLSFWTEGKFLYNRKSNTLLFTDIFFFFIACIVRTIIRIILLNTFVPI